MEQATLDRDAELDPVCRTRWAGAVLWTWVPPWSGWKAQAACRLDLPPSGRRFGRRKRESAESRTSVRGAPEADHRGMDGSRTAKEPVTEAISTVSIGYRPLPKSWSMTSCGAER